MRRENIQIQYFVSLCIHTTAAEDGAHMLINTQGVDWREGFLTFDRIKLLNVERRRTRSFLSATDTNETWNKRSLSSDGLQPLLHGVNDCNEIRTRCDIEDN